MPLGGDVRFAFAALLVFDVLSRRFMCRLTNDWATETGE
jgi:hypothetical protein